MNIFLSVNKNVYMFITVRYVNNVGLMFHRFDKQIPPSNRYSQFSTNENIDKCIGLKSNFSVNSVHFLHPK